jgi:hypothetical protein
MSTPAWKGAPVPRTLLSRDRGEVAAALYDHLQDEGQATELLDFAELNGSRECLRARATFDGEAWTLDLFGARTEA